MKLTWNPKRGEELVFRIAEIIDEEHGSVIVTTEYQRSDGKTDAKGHGPILNENLRLPKWVAKRLTEQGIELKIGDRYWISYIEKKDLKDGKQINKAAAFSFGTDDPDWDGSTLDEKLVPTTKGKKTAKNVILIEPLADPEAVECTREELWLAIREWLWKHYWFRDLPHYDLLALYIVATYLQEEAVSAPFLIFHGDTVTGKSLITAAVMLLTKGGLFVLNPTESAIFRLINDFRGQGMTLFIDEFTFDQRLSASDLDAQDIFKLLRGSSTKGVYVIRTEEIDGERKVVGYDAFGPKGFNTTRIEGLPVDLVNRSLVILCVQAPEDECWREVLPAVDNPEAQRIRGMIRHVVDEARQDGLPETANLRPIKRKDPRLADMGKTLSLAAAVLGQNDVLLAYLRGELVVRREREMESVGPKIVMVLASLPKAKDGMTTMVAIRDAWKDVHEVETWETKDGKKRSNVPIPRTIASALRKLGFEVASKHNRNNTQTLLRWTEVNLSIQARLERRYVTDVTDVTDGMEDSTHTHTSPWNGELPGEEKVLGVASNIIDHISHIDHEPNGKVPSKYAPWPETFGGPLLSLLMKMEEALDAGTPVGKVTTTPEEIAVLKTPAFQRITAALAGKAPADQKAALQAFKGGVR